MVLGLKEIQIRGEIRTNVDYTIDLLHVSFFNFLRAALSSLVPKPIDKPIDGSFNNFKSLCRLQIIERIKYIQAGWTVELQ